jgi:propionyl-CoA carboxylase alpha chain
MNTRLQVEHPLRNGLLERVGECKSEWQEEELIIKQEDLKIKGHAMELRVYAEDPMNDFLQVWVI